MCAALRCLVTKKSNFYQLLTKPDGVCLSLSATFMSAFNESCTMCTSVIVSVFPVVPAYPPSSANVLICCLVQPDGFLTLHWGMMGERRDGGGKEVTCRDIPSLKILLPKLRSPHSAPPFLVSLSSSPLSQDKFYYSDRLRLSCILLPSTLSVHHFTSFQLLT